MGEKSADVVEAVLVVRLEALTDRLTTSLGHLQERAEAHEKEDQRAHAQILEHEARLRRIELTLERWSVTREHDEGRLETAETALSTVKKDALTHGFRLGLIWAGLGLAITGAVAWIVRKVSG